MKWNSTFPIPSIKQTPPSVRKACTLHPQSITGQYTKSITHHFDTYSHPAGSPFDDIGNRETGAQRNEQTRQCRSGDIEQLRFSTETRVREACDPKRQNRPITWTKDNTVITMTYDRIGRRITKITTQGNAPSVEKFVYNGYLCIQTLSNTNTVMQSFIWDPTESIATRPLVFTEGEQTAFYMHDGNKNVTDVISSTSASSDVTHYDYAPFGAVTRTVTATVSTQNSSPITHNSELRSVNPFRFSSEWHDDDLSLVYYNYRHYNPTDGRWINRDPIEEKGGLNLYSFVSNNWQVKDLLGLIGCNEKTLGVIRTTAFSLSITNANNSTISFAYDPRSLPVISFDMFDKTGETLSDFFASVRMFEKYKGIFAQLSKWAFIIEWGFLSTGRYIVDYKINISFSCCICINGDFTWKNHEGSVTHGTVPDLQIPGRGRSNDSERDAIYLNLLTASGKEELQDHMKRAINDLADLIKKTCEKINF